MKAYCRMRTIFINVISESRKTIPNYPRGCQNLHSERLKSQASQYVNFTNRLPVVINYTPQGDEKKLYELTEKYLSIPNKTAYQQMDNYQLSLQFFHTLSSSTQAFSSMLKAPIERATGEEQAVLRTMRDLADNISETAKMTELLKALKTTFSHLKSRRETQKSNYFC